MMFNFGGCEFAADAPERATLHHDGDETALWRIPTIDGGYFETTDDGLRDIKRVRDDEVQNEHD